MKKFHRASEGKKKSPKRDEGFGIRFRVLMGYHDLALRDIAAATQNAVSTVSTWRNGRIPSSPVTIQRLAKLFLVTPSFLLHGRPDASRHLPHNWKEVAAPAPEEKERDALAPGGSSETSSVLLAEQIKAYLRLYIHKASRSPCLLEHMWIQIQKDFSLEDHTPRVGRLAIVL